MKRRLGSVLAATIAGYLSLKEALGREYAVEHDVLAHLDAYLNAAGGDLTSDSFLRWIMTRSHLTSGVRRNWMRIVRNLCLYRRRTDPECFVPDPSQFPPRHQAVRPYVFQDAEIARLIEETRSIPPANRSPLRRQNVLLGLVLLYTAGLRRGELLRLTVGDCDLSEGTLLVRESKFHKSRLLPLSADALHVLKAVLHERQANRLPISRDSALLWNGCGRPGGYSGTGFSQIIWDLLRSCGIRTPAGRLPRIHDFRHTFAVHALLRWYRAGKNVQAKLPALAAYMGHVSIASTECYLHLVEQLAAVASKRFEQHYGALIAEPQSAETRGGRS
jgi:integrase/recombinase XerD